ncbi:MAG: hypothetical protein WAM82_36770 [Thermoanaerobaculia bacterium]
MRSPKAVEQELEEKVPELPNPRGATIGRRIFTRQKPKTAGTSTGFRWHELEDLYT